MSNFLTAFANQVGKLWRPEEKPKPILNLLTNYGSLEHQRVMIVGLYVHRKGSGIPSAEVDKKLVEGKAYIRQAVAVIFDLAAVRAMVGQRNDELWYQTQYFIPCSSETAAGWVKEVEFHARKLKEEGHVVELFTPDQPYLGRAVQEGTPERPARMLGERWGRP